MVDTKFLLIHGLSEDKENVRIIAVGAFSPHCSRILIIFNSISTKLK